MSKRDYYLYVSDMIEAGTTDFKSENRAFEAVGFLENHIQTGFPI